MVHCNNCTSDLNAWVNLFKEYQKLLGIPVDMDELYGKLYNIALTGDTDCGGLLSYNYISGEPVTGLAEGRPLFVRSANDKFNLANFMRAHLYASVGVLKIGNVHEMARQSSAKKYFIARKGPKVYMPDPISVEDKSITTVAQQKLFLGSDDADLIRGKKILLVDDVISTGGSLKAMEALVEKAGGTVTGRMAVLAEGGAADRKDILFLEKLPVFNADGSVK